MSLVLRKTIIQAILLLAQCLYGFVPSELQNNNEKKHVLAATLEEQEACLKETKEKKKITQDVKTNMILRYCPGVQSAHCRERRRSLGCLMKLQLH